MTVQPAVLMWSQHDSSLESPDMQERTAGIREVWQVVCDPDDTVLEIGCGWGGFAEYAAANHDVHVTGLTLSTEMATFARKRLAQAGLAGGGGGTNHRSPCGV